MRTGRAHARHSTAISPWRQVLNEAGYRVHTERLIRNTHLAVHHDDQRRMDLVAAPGARGLGARRGREGKGPEQVVLERATLSPLSGFGTAQCRMPVKGHIDEKDLELQSSVKPGVLFAQFTSLCGKNATHVHHDSVQALRIPTG